MSATILKKLDEVAQRAAAHHGLGSFDPVLQICGTGSFFKGVAACEPGLVIFTDARPSGRLRSMAFLSLCAAGWDEYRRRHIEAERVAKDAWQARKSAHIALHPEDGPRHPDGTLRDDWDESKKWLWCEFYDPEYKRASEAAKLPTTMVEPCEWALREWCARAGTANPLVINKFSCFSSSRQAFEHDLRELFAPLDDEGIAEVMKGWASKLTWDQLRNRAPPKEHDIVKHVLLRGVGRFKAFEIRQVYHPGEALSPPAGSVLIWSSAKPGTMPSARLTSVYPDGVGSSRRKRPAAGSSVDVSPATGAAPRSKAARARMPASPAELRELGHAAWLMAHARSWEVIARACVCALLTPAHPLHAEMLTHGSSPDPLRCLDWRASVEQSTAMRTVREDALRGWPHEAMLEYGIKLTSNGGYECRIERMPDRTDPFGSQTSYWALRNHCGFQQAGQRAYIGMKADSLHQVKVESEADSSSSHFTDVTVTLIAEPSEAALQAIGALQTHDLKGLRAELKRVYASVDGMAGLAEHLLALHEGRFFDRQRFCKAVEGSSRFEVRNGNVAEDGTPPYALCVVMEAGPICGTMYVGIPSLPDRLHIALPDKQTLGNYIEGFVSDNFSDPDVSEPEDVEYRNAILGSGSPPLEPADRQRILAGRYSMSSSSPLTHLQELAPGVPARLNTPVDVQRMINESVLSLYVFRFGLRAATSIQLRKAAATLKLPASVAEAFRRLADPQGVGIRAWRWECRRPFFLLRARGHAVLSRLPGELFQTIAMLADNC